MKRTVLTTRAPDKVTSPFGMFEINERGTVLDHTPTIKYARKRKDLIGRNFFTDIAPCDELKKFNYAEFMESGLTKVFDLADGTKITFLRVNATLSIVLMPAPPEVRPQRHLPLSGIVRRVLRELNELEPKFSIREGKIGFTSSDDELLTVKEAAELRDVTPQAINCLVRQGKLHAIGLGQRFISRKELESFVLDELGRKKWQAMKKRGEQSDSTRRPPL